MSLILKTPRLLLRPFCDSDLEAFLAYRNDPQVYRYQGWRTPYPRTDAEAFIDRMKSVDPASARSWVQIAIQRQDGSNSGGESLIGDVAFQVPGPDSRMAYLGYTLSRAAWGQGYASEAVAKLLDYLYRVRDLHRVVADCDVDNLASIRLLERLGFRQEAHYIESFWIEGEQRWGNEYLYAMLQKEWLLR